MNLGKLLIETNLVSSRLRPLSDPEDGIGTWEILLHSFLYDGEFSKLKFRDKVSLRGRSEYVRNPEILGKFEGFREAVRNRIRNELVGHELPTDAVPAHWRQTVDRLAAAVADAGGKGSDHLVGEVAETVLLALRSSRKLKYSYATVAACEALSFLNFPGFVFHSEQEKKTKAAVAAGGAEFREALLRNLLSHANRSLARKLGPEHWADVDALKAERGVKDLYVRE